MRFCHLMAVCGVPVLRCLKYLSKFKWDHLTEEINYQRAVSLFPLSLSSCLGQTAEPWVQS